jgi:uncharacterized protein YndB with AHSA1/START domain
MSSDQRVTVRRTIAASPHDVFDVVSDPKMHVEIDGSGMLMNSPRDEPLRDVGDRFEMDMDREALGDIPLGKYKVANTVTRFEPDRLIEWNVGATDGDPFGHVYGYEIEASGEGSTVSHYCDWSGVADDLKGVITFPVVPVDMLERSLENLERVVTDRSA